MAKLSGPIRLFKEVQKMQEILKHLEAEEAKLTEQIARLTNELTDLEERRDLIRQLRGKYDERTRRTKQDGENLIPVLHRQSGGRLSLAELRYTRLEYNGQTFRTAGEFLDYVGQPHYFSKKRGGKGDEAQRQIIVWAKRNRDEARRLTVFRDGKSFSLRDILEASLT